MTLSRHLASSRNHCSDAPVSEELWTATEERRKPSPCAPNMTTQFLVFLSGPVDQLLIQLSHSLSKARCDKTARNTGTSRG